MGEKRAEIEPLPVMRHNCPHCISTFVSSVVVMPSRDGIREIAATCADCGTVTEFVAKRRYKFETRGATGTRE